MSQFSSSNLIYSDERFVVQIKCDTFCSFIIVVDYRQLSSVNDKLLTHDMKSSVKLMTTFVLKWWYQCFVIETNTSNFVRLFLPVYFLKLDFFCTDTWAWKCKNNYENFSTEFRLDFLFRCKHIFFHFRLSYIIWHIQFA